MVDIFFILCRDLYLNLSIVLFLVLMSCVADVQQFNTVSTFIKLHSNTAVAAFFFTLDFAYFLHFLPVQHLLFLWCPSFREEKGKV